MLRLVELIGERLECDYLIGVGDELSPRKVKPGGRMFYAHRARDYGDNVILAAFKSLRLCWESFKVLRAAKPEAVISAGPGLAVPISVIAKILGKKVIYIESWSRVYKPSTSGRLVYRFADLFFVQWPELRDKYPKAIYRGRLL
jgi:UDP-N-acetylglucosamine:LPS N-acetylglucosamine transferase